MLKKTIKYTDYNGAERKEDYWFNLSKAEITEMQLSIQGGMAAELKRVMDTQDQVAIASYFKQLILKAYGERTADGKSFIKFDENDRPLANKFKQTEAYSALYMELLGDDVKAAEFFNGIMPADIRKEMEKEQAKLQNN